MNVIQVFNRKSGQWSKRYRLIVGYCESWVIDKTTDTASDIRFFIDHRTEGGTKPDIAPNDWVRLIHVDKVDDPITYTADGLPINSRQYIVDSVKCIFVELSERWDVTMMLAEPIERFNWVLGETLPYTNQTEKRFSYLDSKISKPSINFLLSDRTITLNWKQYFANEVIRTITTSNGSIRVTWSFGTFGYTVRIDGAVVGSGAITQGASVNVSLGVVGNITNIDHSDWQEIMQIQPTGNTVTETYYKQPYNHYTALRRWLMVTPANTDAYTTKTAAIKAGKDLSGETLRIDRNADFPPGNDGDTFKYEGSNFELRMTYIGILSGVQFALYVGGVQVDGGILESPYIEFEMPLNAGYATEDFPNGFDYVERYMPNANNKSWYNRIKILDREFLESLPFSDTTITQETLYGLLMNVFDSSTGRTPVAYFDIDPVTDLPRNLDRDEYLLRFERQDGFDKPVIQIKDLKHRMLAGMFYEQRSDNFATGIVSNAENISGAAAMTYPSQNLYAVPEVDADIRNTTLSPYNQEGTDNWIIRFPHPIKKILKLVRVEVSGFKYESTSYNNYVSTATRVDRTAYVLERQQYLAATPDAQGARYNWYEEGGFKLYLRDMFFYRDSGPSENLKTFMYEIEYEPLVNSRVMVGDTEYQIQLNQSASQVAADKFGNYMQSYLNGMNKADLTIGRNYENFDIFVNQIGSRVVDGDKTYIISQVAYRNRNFTYDVFYQLNENHWRKNNSYKASMSIQKNSAIAISNLKNRKTAIKQVVRIGQQAIAENSSYEFLQDKAIALSALIPTKIDSKYHPQAAMITNKSKLSTGSQVVDFERVRAATVTKLRFNNQVGLNVTFFDNAEAGKSKTVDYKESAGNVEEFGDPATQAPMLYTDPFGEIQKTDIQFSSVTTESFAIGNSTSEAEYNKRVAVLKSMANLPLIDPAIKLNLEANKSIEVKDLNIYKDMLEKFNLNVIIEIASDDCKICSGLLDLSRLLKQTDTHTLKIRVYNEPKSENDSINGHTAERAVTATTKHTDRVALIFAALPTGDYVGETIIVLTNSNEKLLILNNLKTNITSQINIYYK